MREIKFRAWNGIDSRPESRMIYQPYFSVDFKVIMPDGNEWDLPLMQYTGLKDKNGKEIYEGDIFDMGVVIFSRGCFNGCYISGSTNEDGWDYSDEWEDGLEKYAIRNEIKGNIYENPELIK